MKKFLLSIAAMMFAFANVQADNYSHTFTKAVTPVEGVITLSDIAWTIEGDATEDINTAYYGYDNTKGGQFGKGSQAHKSLKFSTDKIQGTISEIKINTSGASSITATLDVTVGGKAFGKQVSLTKSATDYTFDGNASGEIVLAYTQTSSKAIYIKSITVTYTPIGGKETVKTPKFSVEDGSFDSSLEVEITCDTEGATIYYTLDETEPTTESTKYEGAITITETTTVKAFAVKEDFINSSVAVATYAKSINNGTVANALETYISQLQIPATITGYIVGAVDGSIETGSQFSNEVTNATNILIADSDDETDYTKCIVVQLPSGDIRTAINLVDNPTNYKKQIKLTGSLEMYFNVAGLKSLTAYEFLSDPVETAIDEVETEAAEQVIYDLTGRRVYEITETGIYIVNGKKVLVK